MNKTSPLVAAALFGMAASREAARPSETERAIAGYQAVVAQHPQSPEAMQAARGKLAAVGVAGELEVKAVRLGGKTGFWLMRQQQTGIAFGRVGHSDRWVGVVRRQDGVRAVIGDARNEQF